MSLTVSGKQAVFCQKDLLCLRMGVDRDACSSRAECQAYPIYAKQFCCCIVSDTLSGRLTFSLITPFLFSSLASDFLKFQKMMDHLMY